MSNRVTELKPTMTKAKALKLVLDYVKECDYPERDVILDGNIVKDGDAIKIIGEWTFNGLCKYLIDES